MTGMLVCKAALYSNGLEPSKGVGKPQSSPSAPSILILAVANIPFNGLATMDYVAYFTRIRGLMLNVGLFFSFP
jgi:hypothetical protein